MEIGTRNRRARMAVSGAYFVQGLCFATVLSQVPGLKEKFRFTDDDLTLVLAAVPIVAGLGSLLAGALAPRIGSRAVLRAGGPLVCAAIIAVGLVPARPPRWPGSALSAWSSPYRSGRSCCAGARKPPRCPPHTRPI